MRSEYQRSSVLKRKGSALTIARPRHACRQTTHTQVLATVVGRSRRGLACPAGVSPRLRPEGPELSGALDCVTCSRYVAVAANVCPPPPPTAKLDAPSRLAVSHPTIASEKHHEPRAAAPADVLTSWDDRPGSHQFGPHWKFSNFIGSSGSSVVPLSHVA
jgi:hypothetical protein